MLDVYTTTGSVDEEVFLDFLEKSVLPLLLPFNGVNPHSVVLWTMLHFIILIELSPLFKVLELLCILSPQI